ncbi:MAG: hypothetical protein GY725_06645 [bacterium]|nr:hypothetical protein [bacterium]
MLRSATICGLTLAIGCAAPQREGVEEKFNFFPIATYETQESPAGYRLDVLWPLINAHRSGNAYGSRGLPLYNFEDNGEGERTTDILLLYWQKRNEEQDSFRQMLFPIWHYARTPDEWNTHVWPLYGQRRYKTMGQERRTDSVALPLFRYDRQLDGTYRNLGILELGDFFTLYGNVIGEDGARRWGSREFGSVLDKLLRVYHHESRRRSLSMGEDKDVFDDARLTLIEVSSGAVLSVLGGLFELVGWSSEDFGKHHFRLAGLTDSPWISLASTWGSTNRDGQTVRSGSHIFPIYARSTDRDKYQRTWIAPPLFGRETSADGTRTATDILWPLGRYAREDGPDGSTRHVRALPLLWFTRRPDATTNIVFPLYYQIEDRHNSYKHFVPLYGRHDLNDGALQRLFVLPPFYIQTEDKSRQLSRKEILYPFTRFEQSNRGTIKRVFPLFYRRTSEISSHLNILLLLDLERDDVGSKTLLYPLYARRRANGEGAMSSYLPLLDYRYFWSSPPDDESTSLLYPFTNFRRDGEAINRWIFPLYWRSDDSAGNSHHHLWPLFGVDREEDMVTRSMLFPFFFRGSTPDGRKTETGFLYPFGGAKHEVDSDVSWIFPLYYHKRMDPDETTWSSRSWLLWPLFSRQAGSDGSRRWHSLFYLLRSERVAGENGAEDFSFLGMLYKSREEKERSTKSLAFLFHYENDGGEKTLRLFHMIPIRW